MGKRIQIYITLFSTCVLILFIVFVVNQTTMVVIAAIAIHPVFGDVILYGLLSIYVFLICMPVYMIYKLPRALPPPPSDSAALPSYVSRLAKRLENNKYLSTGSYETHANIKTAFADLELIVDNIIRDSASTVFIVTAISQSGRLDGVMVLLTQCRMIWDIATIYNQRPSPLELLRLYQNVAVTTFVASQIEDVDIAERISPIVTEITGASVVGAVPGLRGMANAFANSLIDGSANAFLTLRVGAITKKYCDPLTEHDKSTIRKAASVEAASILGSIVYSSSRTVISEIKRGIGTTSKNTGRALWKKVKGKKSQYEVPDAEKGDTL